MNHVLGGRFVLGRELGSGGVARVFLGSDAVLDRNVAVKVLDPELSGTDLARRFEREGRTAARLSHPNIVQVYDAGDDELDGRTVSYIVMEYVRGGDLRKMISGRGKLREGEAARIGADVASALEHAHEQGVIHRDVKPQNVLIDPYGSPKLADFGIARALDPVEEGAASTSTGSYLGTAVFSSPEQLSGGEITPKSDVYSLGATLYEAVTGKAPFSGAPIEVASQQLEGPPAPPRERGAAVSRPFETLILSCLARDPAERPTAAEVRERLLQISAASNARHGRQREKPPNPAGNFARNAPAAGKAGAAGLLGAGGAARAAGSAGARGLGAVFGGVRDRFADRGASPGAESGAGRNPGPATDREAETVAAPTATEAPSTGREREPAGAAPAGPPPGSRPEPGFRTFQTGPSARAAVLVVGLAVLALVLALLLLASVLRGGGSGEDSGGSGDGGQTPVAASSGGQASGGADDKQARGEEASEPRKEAGKEDARAAEDAAPKEEREEEPSVPAPPVEEAAGIVESMYVALVYNRFEESWGYLSKRYQREVGSLQEWQTRQDSLVRVTFSGGINAERVDENTAKVPVKFTEVRQDGTEEITGTWFLVNEDGQWKLDRFERG